MFNCHPKIHYGALTVHHLCIQGPSQETPYLVIHEIMLRVCSFPEVKSIKGKS